MRQIKLKFCDFEPSFNVNDNYFTRIISQEYEVVISDDPEILFFSAHGWDFLKYKCLRIQFIGENQRPNFLETDYSMSFDYLSTPRNFRWPLYNLYGNPRRLPVYTDKRDKFCGMVVSNATCGFRNRFFELLSRRKPVASGGKYMNNVGGPVKDKMAFLQEYKFSLAFENTAYPGYTTEKLLESKWAGTVPIYWGNPRVNEDFNERSFINVHKFKSFEECIDYILLLDEDEAMYEQMRREPLVRDDMQDKFCDEDVLTEWLLNIIHERKICRHKFPNVLLEPIRSLNYNKTEYFHIGEVRRMKDITTTWKSPIASLSYKSLWFLMNQVSNLIV